MKKHMPLMFFALFAACAQGALAEGASAGVIDLTPLVQAVASLAMSLITAFLIPWIRTKYSGEQQRLIAAAVKTAVCAAEQLFGAGAGEKKLQWAVDQLAEKGLRVDRAAIEAEVLKLKATAESIPDQGVA